MGLCGCSNHTVSDVEPIVKGFKCDFSVADSDLSGELFVNNEGDLSMVFSGPDIINNVGIRVKSLTPKIIDNAITVEGSSQSGGFTAILNGTGYITELRFDEIDMVFKFDNHIL